MARHASRDSSHRLRMTEGWSAFTRTASPIPQAGTLMARLRTQGPGPDFICAYENAVPAVSVEAPIRSSIRPKRADRKPFRGAMDGRSSLASTPGQLAGGEAMLDPLDGRPQIRFQGSHSIREIYTEFSGDFLSVTRIVAVLNGDRAKMHKVPCTLSRIEPARSGARSFTGFPRSCSRRFV
jgi:hypothetical protein